MAKPKRKEIFELKTYLMQDYHSRKVTAQETDQRYIDDKFKVEYLPEGVTQLKTGKAYRMCSAPAEHIITNTPRLYREPVGKATEAAKRVAIECNRWLNLLLRQSPQPLKEHIKKMLGTGEAWIYTAQNIDYDTSSLTTMPVDFVVPHPTIVYVDPEAGIKNGVPNRVIISHDRIAWSIKKQYPQWTWKKRMRDGAERPWFSVVPFTMYIDNEWRYLEADDEAIFVGMQPTADKDDAVFENMLGFVPFVHCYSGFGEGSADGDPKSLAVSRIRNVYDLIEEYTAIKSILNYTIFEYAIPTVDLIYDPAIGEPSGDIGENYERAPGSFNMMGLPAGSTFGKSVELTPPPEMFQYLATIESQIDEEDPLGMIGQTMGTSGRQQIEARESALRRYDTIVENSAHAWEQAFGHALRIIEKLGAIRPKNIQKNDINGVYDVRIELKAEDPIANQIRSGDGDRKQQLGIIDWKTNLTEYQNFTDDEADQIIANSVVDRVLLNDPIMLRTLALDFAQEAGMRDKYEALAAQTEEQANMQQIPNYGAQGGEPRVGNIKTFTGREMPDMSSPARAKRNNPL